MPVADELKAASPNFIRRLREIGFEVVERQIAEALARPGERLAGVVRRTLPGQE